MFGTEEPEVAQPFRRWGQAEGSEATRANPVIGKNSDPTPLLFLLFPLPTSQLP